jgi:hypothetical protein
VADKSGVDAADSSDVKVADESDTKPAVDSDIKMAARVEPAPLLKDEWLNAVLETSESDVRGDMIALTYHKYALRLREIIYGEPVDDKAARIGVPDYPGAQATWFNFGTWGTITVTGNIANRRPPQRLLEGPRFLRRDLSPLVMRERASDGQEVSQALSWGQRLIFISACYTMLQFQKHMNDPDHPERRAEKFEVNPETIKKIQDNSRCEPGTPIQPARYGVRNEHFDLLTKAFELYRLAARAQQDDEAAPSDEAKTQPDNEAAPSEEAKTQPDNEAAPSEEAKTQPDDEAARSEEVKRTDVARFILGANILLTAVEQDLAQIAVRVVIEHMPKRARAQLERRTSRLASALTDLPRQLVDVSLRVRDDPAAKLMDTAWSRLMTDQILIMALPTESLRLGRDIPPRLPGMPFYPSELQHLGYDPDDLPDPLRGNNGKGTLLADRKQELVEEAQKSKRGTANYERIQEAIYRIEQLELVARTVLSFDRTRGGGRGSAASDWRQFADRLNWAVALIRSRQSDESLYWPPFSCADEELIRARRLPERGGDPSDLEVVAPPDPGPYRLGQR